MKVLTIKKFRNEIATGEKTQKDVSHLPKMLFVIRVQESNVFCPKVDKQNGDCVLPLKIRSFNKNSPVSWETIQYTNENYLPKKKSLLSDAFLTPTSLTTSYFTGGGGTLFKVNLL